jgi:hypothetical protein
MWESKVSPPPALMRSSGVLYSVIEVGSSLHENHSKLSSGPCVSTEADHGPTTVTFGVRIWFRVVFEGYLTTVPFRATIRQALYKFKRIDFMTFSTGSTANAGVKKPRVLL